MALFREIAAGSHNMKDGGTRPGKCAVADTLWRELVRLQDATGVRSY